MHSQVSLLLKMVRWRVAIVLVIFMLLGAAWQGLTLQWQLLLAAVSVMASYASATSINDIADFEIDKINLPKDPSRPLATGHTQRRTLAKTAALASLIAISCGFVIHITAGLLLCAAVLVNTVYSLPPFKISHRPLLTPLFLPIGYVVIPFMIGVAAMRGQLAWDGWLCLVALYSLFVGRIILKDFRDRKGDAAFGKRTFLLAYGKWTTVVVSAIAIIVGYTLLIIAVYAKVGLPGIFIAPFGVISLVMLRMLYVALEGKPEQVTIGVGAKIGNGMLLTILGLLVLRAQSAPTTTLFVVVALFATIYTYNFFIFLRQPGQSTIAYKA